MFIIYDMNAFCTDLIRTRVKHMNMRNTINLQFLERTRKSLSKG